MNHEQNLYERLIIFIPHVIAPIPKGQANWVLEATIFARSTNNPLEYWCNFK